MEAIMQSVCGFRFTITEIFAYPIICFIVILWYHYKWNRRDFDKLATRLKGPRAYPIIGSALRFMGTPQGEANNTLLNQYDESII